MYLTKSHTRGFFGVDSDFQNCFWNVFITSGFSQICKNVFKFQEDYSEHGIRVFLENGLESFQTFLIYKFEKKQN
jgi:hypothetical protein